MEAKKESIKLRVTKKEKDKLVKLSKAKKCKFRSTGVSISLETV